MQRFDLIIHQQETPSLNLSLTIYFFGGIGTKPGYEKLTK
jgi:hypothetical protein